MTTTERRDIRQALLEAGFSRTTSSEPDQASFYDRGNGAYTEIWRSDKDRTKITLEWDVKTYDNIKTI